MPEEKHEKKKRIYMFIGMSESLGVWAPVEGLCI